MIVLRPKQMIFTRVEPEYSPRHRSGYQTVYHSPALSTTDVKAIEKRVQCFHSKDSSLVRHQFFSLDSGQVVLTHSVTIDSHPQIVDKNRRRGVFLAHCLIFTRREFDKADNNPFKIFDAFTFLDDAETMVREFNQTKGKEPTCRIELERGLRSSGSESWSAEAHKLVTLAEQGAIKAKSQSILFYGSENEIDEALRAVFDVVPKRTRLACSFDTHIERCMTPRGLYWAVGAPSRQGGSYIYINAASRQVGKFEAAPDTSDMYIAWLQHVAGRSSHEVMTQLPTIQELNEAFKDRRPIQATLDEEASQSFFALHQKRIMEELSSALSSATSPKIGALLAEHLLNVADKKTLLDIAASHAVMPKSLSSDIETWLLEQAPHFAALTGNDWKILQEVAHHAPNHTLLFWAAVGSNNKKLRQEALMKMDNDEFSRGLRLMLNPINPADFVTPQHLPALLDKVEPIVTNLEDEPFVDFLTALIAVGEVSALDALANRVFGLENKALTCLEKELQKSDNVSERFAEAVHRRREELGAPAGWRGTLSTLFNKLLG